MVCFVLASAEMPQMYIQKKKKYLPINLLQHRRENSAEYLYS